VLGQKKGTAGTKERKKETNEVGIYLPNAVRPFENRGLGKKGQKKLGKEYRQRSCALPTVMLRVMRRKETKGRTGC